MLEEIIFELKSSATSTLKIVFYIDKNLTEKMKIALHLLSIFQPACLATYQVHHGKMGVNCYGVNQDFMRYLITSENRPAIADYNNLFMPSCSKESPLFGSHHIVHLQYSAYHIGIDAAVEQFRKDNVIAEITISNSYLQLNKLLMNRYKLTTSWLINEMPKDHDYVALLQKARGKPLEIEEKKESVIPVKSSSRCIIL